MKMKNVYWHSMQAGSSRIGLLGYRSWDRRSDGRTDGRLLPTECVAWINIGLCCDDRRSLSCSERVSSWPTVLCMVVSRLYSCDELQTSAIHWRQQRCERRCQCVVVITATAWQRSTRVQHCHTRSARRRQVR